MNTQAIQKPTYGTLFVITGPSGAGKTSILRHLMQQCPHLMKIITTTTRHPRHDELAGVDYDFISYETFIERQALGHFIECNEYANNWYATPRNIIPTFLEQGRNCLLLSDVNGAKAVKEEYKQTVVVWIDSPIDELRARLEHRNTESNDAIENRIQLVLSERHINNTYSVSDHELENDDLRKTSQQVEALITEYLSK